MSDRDLMQQCLDTLESLQGGCTDSDDGTVEAITVWCPELIDALRAALAQPEVEPVAWQVRWTNPGNNPDADQSDIEWKPVAPKYSTTSVADEITKLRAYRYDGKPCYEVRPLYATPQAQPAPVPYGWVMVPREPSIAMCIAGDGARHNVDDATKTPTIYRAMIAAAPGSAPAAPAVRARELCPHEAAVNDWMHATAAPAVLEPLTAERLQKHAMFAADAPPASAVVLVSSLHRLLGITGDSNG